MNARKPSNALTHIDVRRIEHLWHEAWRSQLPLNTHLSVKPLLADSLTPGELCRIFDRIKNLYGVFAKRNRFQPRYIWVRESLTDNSRNHLHLYCYAPPRVRADLIAKARDWLPIAGEIEARPVHNRVQWLRTGKSKSALGYLIKNMTPQAAFRRPYLRAKGGAVIGKRWGCSRTLRAFLIE